MATPHGTRSGYSHHGCRCHECRAAAVVDNRAWRDGNPDGNRAYQAAYRRANPDKIAGYSAARAAAPYTPEALVYGALLLGDPCVYCGGESDEIDHIVPVSKGGRSDWNNLAPACRSCNARKSAKPLLLFLLGNHRPPRA